MKIFFTFVNADSLLSYLNIFRLSFLKINSLLKLVKKWRLYNLTLVCMQNAKPFFGTHSFRELKFWYFCKTIWVLQIKWKAYKTDGLLYYWSKIQALFRKTISVFYCLEFPGWKNYIRMTILFGISLFHVHVEKVNLKL